MKRNLFLIVALLLLVFGLQAQEKLRLELQTDIPARVSINGSRMDTLKADSVYQFFHTTGQKFIRVIALDNSKQKFDTELMFSQTQRYQISLKSNPPRITSAATNQVSDLSQYLPVSTTINTLQRDGFAALHLAIKAKDLVAIKALVGGGANVNLQSASAMHPSEEIDVGKQTPLLLAVELGIKDAVIYLLDKGANVNQTDAIGNTPLHRAVEYNHAEIVRVLLKNGASVQQKDEYFRLSPMKYAQKLRRKEILKILKGKG